jgi:hypothetical protein
MARAHRTPELPMQAVALRERFGGRASVRRGQLTWTGTLQPSGYSECYTVTIRAQRWHHPLVAVRHPELVPNENGWLPHFYPDTKTLCLYDPKADEWSPRDWLAETIVPWTAEWLIYYELWRVTGLWHGSGDDMAWANDPGNQPTLVA